MHNDELTQPYIPLGKANKTKQLSLEEDIELSRRGAGPMDRGMPRPWRIAIIVPSMSTQIVVDLHDKLYLGRTFPKDAPFPGVDLTPFRAYEAGVSRRHAILSLKNDQIAIMDDESANGTLLNGELLEPNNNYPLRHGDRVRLGKLDLKFEMLSNPYSFG